MEYLEKNPNALKRSSSLLSPLESSHQQKKPNIQTSSTPPSLPMDNKKDIHSDDLDATKLADAAQTAIKEATAPILSEIQLLRETVHSDYKKLHTNYTELKDSITSKSNKVAESLNKKIDANTEKITQMIDENRLLWRENASLKDCVSSLELNQVWNNIIISGILESKWEPYDTTVARVHDTIAAAISTGDIDQALEEARSIEIVCCNWTGRYQMGRLWPISVTLQNYSDKEKILQDKRNLPTGIYINEEKWKRTGIS